MKKKLFVILMTVCMAVVFVPALSWALGDTDETEPSTEETKVENTTSSDEDEGDSVLNAASDGEYTITTGVYDKYDGSVAGTFTGPTSANAGDTVKLTLTLYTGYSDALDMNGVIGISDWNHNDDVFTFTMPSNNVTFIAKAGKFPFSLESEGNVTYYQHISGAVNDAQDKGDTIKLHVNQDIEFDEFFPLNLHDKDITLDFNGYSITYASEGVQPRHIHVVYGTLNIKNGYLYSRHSQTDWGAVSLSAGNKAVVKIESGQFGGAFETNKKDKYYQSDEDVSSSAVEGKIILTGGYYNNKTNTDTYTDNGYIASEIPYYPETKTYDEYYPSPTFFKEYSVYCVWNPDDAEATITWKNTTTEQNEIEYYYELERAVKVAQNDYDGYEFVQMNLLKDATVEASMTVSKSIKMVMNDDADITSTSNGVFRVSDNATFTLEGSNKNVISSMGKSSNNVIIVNSGSTLKASNIKVLYNNDTNYNSTIRLISNQGTLILSESTLEGTAAQLQAIYNEGTICIDKIDIVISSGYQYTIITGIYDAAHSADTLSNVQIAITAANDMMGSICGISTSGGISIDESVSIKINNSGATARGINFSGSGSTITKANISVASNNNSSACVYASQPIVIYGGYYSNKKSNGENSEAVAFDGESSDINAIGGVYTKEVSSGYVHDTDQDKNKYQCIALNPTITYDGVVYTHTIVPKEVCKLTTASNTTGTVYNTLQAAIDAINASDTNCKITLLKNINTLSGLSSGYANAQFNFVKDKSGATFDSKFPVTLDMAGKSITIPKVDYPLFIENCNLTLVNSSSSNSTISNGDGDAIHVGAEKTGADYSKLIIDNTANNISISASKLSENAIKTGWEYKDGSGNLHTCIGTVLINGGYYYGDITKGVSGSEYTISGGYYTDGKLYTGYTSDQEKHGEHGDYIAKYYACINNPDDNKNTYLYKVVPDKDNPKLYGSTVTISGKTTVNFYISNFVSPDSSTGRDLADANSDFNLVVTFTSGESTYPDKIRTRTYDIPKTTTKIGSAYKHKVSFSELTPKQLGDVISAKIVDNKTGITVTTIKDRSVAALAKVIITNKNNSYSDIDVGMNTGLLNYGAAAQTEFSYNTANLVNKGRDDTEFDLEKWGNSSTPSATWNEKYTYNLSSEEGFSGATSKGQSLVMDTTTTLRFYFTLDAGKKLSDFEYKYEKGTSVGTGAITIEPAQIGKKESVGYYIDVPDIVSTRLMIPYTLKITDKSSGKSLCVTSSVTDYLHDSYSSLGHSYLGRTTCVLDDYSVQYSNSKKQ